MIKAVFFDIDGTLISFTRNMIPPEAMDALHQLQEKGIMLFIASGRPPIQLQILPESFQQIRWDGYVLMNGQYCMDADRKELRRHPISKESLHVLIPWLKENADYPCTFMELDYSYDLQFNQGYYDYLSRIGRLDQMPPVDDPERAYTHDTYQICPYIPAEMDEEWVRHAPGMKSARWIDSFADMIPADGGKPEGLRFMLERYGFTREECMAFGDGGNDITMLEYAGIGVAMGNAGEEVKRAADYVTDHVDEAGLLNAFKYFGML